jgi:hypothetical protein
VSAPQPIRATLAALQQRNFEALKAQAIRIRPGQRRLIFAVTGRLGLRDEQLHDLVEWASDERTRAISKLTIVEARRLTGLLKRMEKLAAP